MSSTNRDEPSDGSRSLPEGMWLPEWKVREAMNHEKGPTMDEPTNANLWLSEDRTLALEAALKRVMRHQAKLLEAWATKKRYDEDSDLIIELIESRQQGKAALRYPQPRFSERPADHAPMPYESPPDDGER